MNSYDTIDEYISSFPPDTQEALSKLRKLIHDIEPNVTEDMSYKMPSFKLNGKPLVYFAGWNDHIGFYPTPNGMNEFKEELKPYATGKGTAHFPLEKPLPEKLITKIVTFRASEITAKKR